MTLCQRLKLAGGTAGDGLRADCKAQGSSNKMRLVSPTEHESIYSVAWDMSRDPNRVSTTPLDTKVSDLQIDNLKLFNSGHEIVSE